MRLYTSAGSFYCPDCRADDRNQIPKIDQPCLVLLGSSSREDTLKAFTPGMLIDGFLGRVHLFEGNDNAEEPDTFSAKGVGTDTPEKIIKAVKYWANKRLNPVSPHDGPDSPSPNVKEVPVTDEAALIYNALVQRKKEYRRILESPARDLWGRVVEQADQLALIYACSKNPESPVIDIDAAQWGADLSEYLTKRKVCLADGWVSISPTHAKQQEVMRYLAKMRENGERVTQSALTKRFGRWPKREREEILGNLRAIGAIRFIENQGVKGGTWILTK